MTDPRHQPLPWHEGGFQHNAPRPAVVWVDDEGPTHLSSYPTAEHGPPPPAWVITTGSAIETDLGVLKTGKEANCHLVLREHDGRSNLLVAKRYRGRQHRQFRNDVAYRQRRATGESRIDRAIRR